MQDFVNFNFVGKRWFEKVSFSNGRSCQSWVGSHDEGLKTQQDSEGTRHQLQPNPCGRGCLFSQWTERERCSSVSEGETFVFSLFHIVKSLKMFFTIMCRCVIMQNKMPFCRLEIILLRVKELWSF